MESSSVMNLIITTASKALARHLVEKFASVGFVDTPAGKKAPLRVIELDGNGRTGVALKSTYPTAVQTVSAFSLSPTSLL
jgi:DNA repair protein SbcC/Rad50